MAIEQNIEDIVEKLGVITAWQEGHQIEDRKNFGEIRDILANVATKKENEETVAKAVTKTVNGKLDKIKEHLDAQDVSSADLRAKILPLDNTRVWAMRLVSAILYLGGLAAAIAAIIYLLQQLKILK